MILQKIKYKIFTWKLKRKYPICEGCFDVKFRKDLTQKICDKCFGDLKFYQDYFKEHEIDWGSYENNSVNKQP